MPFQSESSRRHLGQVEVGEIPDGAPIADAARVVRQAPWAASLDAAALDRVVGSLHLHDYPAEACIARAGERVEHWIGIVEGFAKMSVSGADGRASTLTGVCDGVWFGEGSLIKHEPRRYDVYALRPTRAAFLPRATFEWLRRTSIPFNHHLQDLLNARLSLFIGILEHDRLLDTDARVAHALASLFHAELYARAPRMLALRQGEIALLANVSRQRANVALQRLARLGLIRLESRGLTVLDVDGLGRFAAEQAGDVAQSRSRSDA